MRLTFLFLVNIAFSFSVIADSNGDNSIISNIDHFKSWGENIIAPTILDKSNEEVKISENQARKEYLIERAKFQKEEWRYTMATFWWQYYSSILSFVIVVLLVFSGLYFAYLQFRAFDFKHKDSEHQVTVIKISKNGFEISSPVVGLLVLFFAFGFFYLYVSNIYPIDVIDNKSGIEKSHTLQDEPKN